MTVNHEAVAFMIEDESIDDSIKIEIISRLSPFDAIRVGLALASLIKRDKNELDRALGRQYE